MKDDRNVLVSIIEGFVQHLDGGGLDDGELSSLLADAKLVRRERLDAPPLEILSMPVLGTCNLSPEEGQRDAHEWPTHCLQGEYGFVVYFGKLADLRNVIATTQSELEDDSQDPLELWPGFLAAAEWAEHHGFEWVRFDRDAEAQPGLPVWEW